MHDCNFPSEYTVQSNFSSPWSRQVSPCVSLVFSVHVYFSTNGGLISKCFKSLLLKSPKKGANSFSWELSTKKENAQESDLAPLFWDLSQSERLSEIKSPLSKFDETILHFQSHRTVCYVYTRIKDYSRTYFIILCKLLPGSDIANKPSSSPIHLYHAIFM